MPTKRTNQFGGNVPDGASFVAHHKTGWTLYLLVDRSSDKFLNLKLITTQRRAHFKTNYWLAWHIKEDRMVKGGDAAQLYEDCVDVFEWVEEQARAFCMAAV